MSWLAILIIGFLFVLLLGSIGEELSTSKKFKEQIVKLNHELRINEKRRKLISELENEIKELQHKIKELEKERRLLKNEERSQAVQLIKKNNLILNQKAKIDELNSQTQVLESKYKSSRFENQQLKNKIDRLKEI